MRKHSRRSWSEDPSQLQERSHPTVATPLEHSSTPTFSCRHQNDQSSPLSLSALISSQIYSSSLILFGMLWCVLILQPLPGAGGVPLPILYSGSSSATKDIPSVLESAVYNLMEKAREEHDGAAKARNVFSKRNMWELISSTADVIPLASRMGNVTSPQWLLGGGDAARIEGSVTTPSQLSRHSPQLSVETRLERLSHHFNSLRVFDEDCRQRLLCELAEAPAKYAPLTSAFLDETRFNGDEKSLATKLLQTNDGTKLLTYIDAAQRGSSRQGCEIWTYRCARGASAMIDLKSLLVWRELSKWLTVKFVAGRREQQQ